MKPLRIEWQISFWLAALFLFVITLWLFSDVLLPFVAAVVLGYLLDPVADRLEHAGLNRLGATLLILATFILCFVTFFILIVPILGHQLAEFIQSLPSYLNKLQTLISSQSERWANEYGGAILEKLGLSSQASQFNGTTTDLVNQAMQWGGTVLKSLWSRGAALLNLLSLMVITPVVAFYMLLDWDRMIAVIDSLVPIRHRETVRELAREIDKAMAGFVRGQSLVCLFLGLWYGLGLSLVGLNFGLLIGISAGVLSFVPYVGSLVALVLAAGVAIVQDFPQWKLLAMSMGVVVTGQFLEGNILSPKLVGGSVGLHPVWLIFALLAFGSLFGFTGLLAAVPLAAAAGVILRFAIKRYRESNLYRGEAFAGDAAFDGTQKILIEVSAAPERQH